MTIQTCNAGMTKQTHPSMFEPEKTRAVLVDGQVVGHYGKNKYGITIGHCNPQAVAACRRGENPFVMARSTHWVHPTRRGSRRTADVVRDIALAAR